MSTRTRNRAGQKPAGGRRGPRRGRRAARGLSAGMKLGGVVMLAVVGLGAIYYLANSRGPGGGRSGEYPYQVGRPGPGEEAPAVRLPSTAGGTLDLASLRGETVLLYFQEGLMCQPCWDQLADIEKHGEKLRAAGVTRIVSITTDPPDALRRKVADEGLSTPVLADPDRTVSRSYDTTSYGMMGMSHNGHSFILVGPDGRIRWRADYGGAPKYFMYVPVETLLADLREGVGEAGS